MPFPEIARVIYRKNPLEQVICQIRFDTILVIESEAPTRFQEVIRGEYPQYSEPIDLPIPLPQEISQHLPPVVIQSMLQTTKKYEFTSSDGEWTVTLTRDFLALTCRAYKRWEDFKAHFETPLATFIKCYQPPYFSRVGLRYQNVIRRSLLNLSETSWAKLLKPHIAAEFQSNIAEFIDEAGHTLTIRLQDIAGQVRIQHGIIQNLLDDNRHSCYLIDNDFFTNQRTGVEDVRDILDHFNARSGRLFRWCISETLHESMEPETIP